MRSLVELLLGRIAVSWLDALLRLAILGLIAIYLPGELDRYSVLSASVQIAGVVGAFGIPQVLPVYAAKKDNERLAARYGLLFWALQTTLLSMAMLALWEWGLSHNTLALAVGTCGLLGDGLTRAVSRGSPSPRTEIRFSTFAAGGALTLALLLALGASPSGAAVVLAIGGIRTVAAAVSLFLATKGTTTAIMTVADFRQLTVDGVRAYWGVGAAVLLYRVDIVLLGRYGISDTGAYFLAVTAMEASLGLSSPFRTETIRLQASGASSKARRSLATFVVVSVGLLCISTLGVMLFVAATQIVLPVAVVASLVVSGFGLILGRAFSTLIFAAGLPLRNSIAALVGLVLNVLLNLLLIPMYGVLGAAIATAIAYWAVALVLSLFYRSLTQQAGL